MRQQTQTPVVFLLPLRLFVGWVFLTEALSKLTTGWIEGGRLGAVVSGWLKDGRAYEFYATFLREAVIPHSIGFTYLVIGGELLVGAALLAGLFSRFASIGGMFLALNYMLGRGDGIGPNPTAPIVAICLTMALSPPGRALGVDAALKGKLPSWLC
jgi:thiosulfate dehydrogenase [quinone] large subunit